jgi:glutamyl-tRNA synthetase
MSSETIKTRFAPSPTGFLHLGNVRTALFSWLLARHTGGVFLLRIEDTDLSRSTDEAAQAIFEDLRWLGLQWDEGPEAGGTAGPYRQSERTTIYENYYAKLQKLGLAYPCFCSPAELAVSRKVQLASGRPPRYPGTCAHLSERDVAARIERGIQPTLRFRVADGRTIKFDDLVRGSQRFLTDDIGDFIIRRADGSAAFFFTNAVDDALMGVTDVLRGEDHLSNTPRQILLLEALGLPVPRYGHISLIVGEDGGPLSKRQGSLGVRDLRERGYLPLAVNNALARLGHYYEDSVLMTFEELAKGFSVAQLGRAPARFDPAQLDHWQKLAVCSLNTHEFAEWMGEGSRGWVPASSLEGFVAAIRANVTMPEEARTWARIVYADPLEITGPATQCLEKTPPHFFEQALEVSQNDYPTFIAKLKELVPERGKRLFEPLRAALTGRLDGPELASLFVLMGSDRIRDRLRNQLRATSSC